MSRRPTARRGWVSDRPSREALEIPPKNPDHASTSSAEAERADGPSMSEDFLRESTTLPRRAILRGLATLGIGSTTFHRALAAQAAQAGSVTPEMIQQAEWIAGLELTEDERKETAGTIRRSLSSFEALRKVEVGYDVPPAPGVLSRSPGLKPAEGVRRNQASPSESHAPKRPDSDEGLAFLPVTELSALVRSGQVSSTELTKLYLGRLKRFDPLLKCVVTLTEDLAPEAGGEGRRRDRGRDLPRSAPRHPLGGEGPDRVPRLPDDLGRLAVQGPGDRREGDRRRPARRGRRGAGRQAEPRGARDGRPLVRRDDPEPVGPAPRVERLVGRLGLGGRGGPGRVRDRQRDAGQHRLPLPGLRGLGPPADLRPGQPARLHVALVVDGQARPDRPIDGGLRPGPRRHPRRRRPGRHRRRPALRLAASGLGPGPQGRLLPAERPPRRRPRRVEDPQGSGRRAGADQACPTNTRSMRSP